MTATALGADSVTPNAIAPDSVHGYALGPVNTYTTPIADLDSSADLSIWTTSNGEGAVCATGERLIAGGVSFTNPGNRRVGIAESLPVVNSNTNAFFGQITSDSGGTATAQVQAICLK